MLDFFRGKNNGITQGKLAFKDPNTGAITVFDLTGATVDLIIFDPQSKQDILTIPGTVVNGPEGLYMVKPNATTFNSFPANQLNRELYYKVSATNATYPQGYVFAKDAKDDWQRCRVF